MDTVTQNALCQTGIIEISMILVLIETLLQYSRITPLLKLTSGDTVISHCDKVNSEIPSQEIMGWQGFLYSIGKNDNNLLVQNIFQLTVTRISLDRFAVCFGKSVKSHYIIVLLRYICLIYIDILYMFIFTLYYTLFWIFCLVQNWRSLILIFSYFSGLSKYP